MSAEVIDFREKQREAWDAYMLAKDRFDAAPCWETARLCGRAWLNLMNSFCPPDKRAPANEIIEFPRSAL